MARLASKRAFRQGGSRVGQVHENAILPGLFLTFAGCGGLTPAIIGKTFFSTRRPALEAGGQRPTARCALGRKNVWFGVFAFGAEIQLKATSPRKAGDPVTGSVSMEPRSLGILGTALSRGMTAVS